MNKLEEDGLQIDFADAVGAIKFDQNDPALADFHDIGTMPRVDFVVEMEHEIYFIELKDPGRPNAIDVGATKLLKKIENGTLEASLIEKYIFTFFFRWAEGKLHKSVHYVCLITLDSPQLLPLTERLEKQLDHLFNSSVRWVRKPLASCQVHNIETWMGVFPNWPVIRLPAVAV